ncbi:hypothetical protein BKP35_14205 [Anaerobacillus arseniciselenatis]|uniref:DNA 3'-5' helicase n=1 Tax=Anaerobacillus arseniciselenatis TaxID=85682 RepID=A0A1S2LCM1_9BACI|nr:UvrD-helicase domain-containing protein [Anaerobacillus arseniciselenatis]OIJ10248.1 hypothetical protein BKP35_14205 [Anaerobacillus arseniciselenatis]
MNFNKEQEAAIYSEKPLVVISAGAGSGKTRVLTERYVYLCEKKLQQYLQKEATTTIGAAVEEIVAITFTEKAAREMKDRIRGRVEEIRNNVETLYAKKDQEIAVKFWQEQKEALDSALITTFHSFCHKLLHEYAFEADIPPSFQVLDDVQAKLMQIDIFEGMFDSPEYHREWHPLYRYYTRDQLKESIKTVYGQMKEIITSVSSVEQFFDCETIIEMQLKAIEQSQKEVLYQFYQSARPYVMELDDSQKAQKKIVDHFSFISDNSFENPTSLYEELKESMPKRISNSWQESNPPLYELYEQLFKPLKETWKTLTGPSPEEIEELKQIIKLFVHMLAVFHEKYDQVKRERAAMDFSDLQQRAISLLERPEVQNDCRKKYRHMMVDEFQDTNQLQMNMLTYIKPQYQFVVGDGKQSIYRFRGADVSLMKELVERSKQELTGEFINMSTNYRTCDSIIQFVNFAFNEIMGSDESSSGPSYKISYSNINSHRNGPNEQQCRVEMITVPPEPEVDEEQEQEQGQQQEQEHQSEYEVIVNRMIGLMKEQQPIVSDKHSDEEIWRAPTWSDFAILIQTRSKLTKLEKALKDKAVPYVVYGGIGFYEKQEVRDMLNLLKWVNRPWESLYILSLLRSPLFGVSIEGFLAIDDCLDEEVSLASYIYEGVFVNDENIDDELRGALTKLKQFYDRWVPYVPQASKSEYLQHLFEQSGLKKQLLLQRNNLQQVKNVEKLIEVLAQFQTASLDELLEQVKQLAALSDKEGEAEVELAEGNMVHIMTVHASKGLEFPIVFLPDLAKAQKGDSGSIRFDKDVRLAVQYNKEKENDPLKTDKKSSPSFERIKQVAKDQAVEEAKRLFYVATTRAKDYLVLSTVDKRSKNSWYDMLLTASEQSGQLNHYINENCSIPEQNEWIEEGELYSPPTIVEHNNIPVTFSVSEIMAYMNDPLKYYYKYIVKVEDGWLEDQEENDEKDRFENSEHLLSGATVGTIVHRACELLDNGFPLDEAKEEALAIIDDELNKHKYERELDHLVEKYEQLTQLNIGKTVANEWAFSVEIEGAIVIGEIDKIVEKDGQYHLIDLKTNKAVNYDQLVTYYTPQLYLYKLAFEKVYGEKASEMSLFFMRAGKEGLKTITFDDAVETQVRETIKKLTFLRRNSVSKSDFQ